MLREQFSEALKAAMKAQEPRRVATLRLIIAAIKDRDIAARSEDRAQGISDDEIMLVLAKMIKQRRESAKTYEDAGRLDLAEGEREEVEIIQDYLPKQMSEDEIRSACCEVTSELGASNLKDMGKCMGALKERYTGKMDFAKASPVLKQLLNPASNGGH
jgi:uncharacterized protein YqeY